MTSRVLFAILFLGMFACNRRHTFQLPDPLPERSVYNLNSSWTTQDGRTIQLRELGGKVNVAAMIFTSCGSACPRITADLQRIETEVQKKYPDEVCFVLISMDPDRDTPAKLMQFAHDHQLDLRRWTLLTGNPDDVMEIANVLDVRFKKSAEGGIDHSNIIHVLSPAGEIVHQQTGLAVEPKETLEAIDRLYQ